MQVLLSRHRLCERVLENHLDGAFQAILIVVNKLPYHVLARVRTSTPGFQHFECTSMSISAGPADRLDVGRGRAWVLAYAKQSLYCCIVLLNATIPGHTNRTNSPVIC